MPPSAPASPAEPTTTRPVFTAASATRPRVLAWSVRGGVLAVALLLVVAVGTLLTGVPLPGLGPLGGGAADRDPQAGSPARTGAGTAGAGSRAALGLPDPSRGSATTVVGVLGGTGPGADVAPRPAALTSGDRTAARATRATRAATGPVPTSTPSTPSTGSGSASDGSSAGGTGNGSSTGATRSQGSTHRRAAPSGTAVRGGTTPSGVTRTDAGTSRPTAGRSAAPGQQRTAAPGTRTRTGRPTSSTGSSPATPTSSATPTTSGS